MLEQPQHSCHRNGNRTVSDVMMVMELMLRMHTNFPDDQQLLLDRLERDFDPVSKGGE